LGKLSPFLQKAQKSRQLTQAAEQSVMRLNVPWSTSVEDYMSKNQCLGEMVRNMPVGFYGKFATHIDGERYTWFIQTLVEATKDLPVVRVNLGDLDIDLDENVWFHSNIEPTTRTLIVHIQRIENADLRYPIIISKKLGLLDGYHRLVKAHIRKKSAISVVYIEEMPDPDFVGVF
jgi:hypothetical protein